MTQGRLGRAIDHSFPSCAPTNDYPVSLIKSIDRFRKPYRNGIGATSKFDLAICTNCKACERECPISCIAITDSEEPDKKRWMSGFDIDLAKCMYCGICSEVCPTGAIHHSPEFEGSCHNPAAMVRHFVLDGAPVPSFKPKKGEEADTELAKKVDSGKEFMDLFAQP